MDKSNFVCIFNSNIIYDNWLTPYFLREPHVVFGSRSCCFFTCFNGFWHVFSVNFVLLFPGSYFARDATYSHSYTSNTVVRTMFVSRVLVGSYTKGASSYVRPPSKDGGDVNFYDSCVDNVLNPSIFVVFEKHQIYPEYLIQYRSADLLDDFVHPTPAPAPAPTKCVIA